MKSFKNTLFAIVCILITFIILQSCQKMKYGNVIEKWYEPEENYTTFIPIIISTGKTTSTILVPFLIHDKEDWCIKVKGIGVKGDTITRTYYVTPLAYDTLSIGKFICVDGACDEDNNNKKERK